MSQSDQYLPELPGVPKGLRAGRSVYEGYQRGWGLEFGDLRERVAQDQDFRDAYQAVNGRSVMMLERMMNAFLIIKFYLPRLSFGHIIEYGSYRGGSALFMAALAKRLLPGVQVYALDTFEGMPPTDRAIDVHSAGDFASTNVDEIRSAAAGLGLDNLHCVKGLFEDTAPALLRDVGRIALAHIDCDIYSACRFAYDVTKPYMVDGGYYVFDDATVSSCIGATEVVEDFVIGRDGLRSEQIYPHFVFRHPGLASV